MELASNATHDKSVFLHQALQHLGPKTTLFVTSGVHVFEVNACVQGLAGRRQCTDQGQQLSCKPGL